SPGHDSAVFGHHYAHHSNHFWKCLHRGGFTPELLPPSAGIILPKKHNIGLTNLIERPSSEVAELAPTELTAAVPALLAKIRRRRPRAVCFVGKVIWEAITRSLKKHSVTPMKARANKFAWGLQPYKIPHAVLPLSSPPLHLSLGSQSGATLLYVVPSTSARVVSHQLDDKAKLFAALRALVDSVNKGTFDGSGIVELDV
ncbi:uracil-DNA glycosylase-like protein, partial [Vararia minispora EC-137]